MILVDWWSVVRVDVGGPTIVLPSVSVADLFSRHPYSRIFSSVDEMRLR